MLRMSFGLLAIFGAAPYLIDARSTTNIPGHSIPVFAVGFDITDTYGIASVRLAGGEVRLAARVDGDDNWTEFMQRLGSESSRHTSPPYEYWHDGGVMAGVGDLPRQLLRRARKAVGLPASADAGTISSMLTALREETEKTISGALLPRSAYTDCHSCHTSIAIDRVVLTSPELPGLYDEDIRDAALHSGIELLYSADIPPRAVADRNENITRTLKPWIARQPKHSHALFAAYGLAGNLSLSTTPGAGSRLKKHSFLLVHLTKHGLELVPQIKWTNRSCALSWGQHMGWYSPSLGWPSHLPEAEWQLGVMEMVHNATEYELRSHYQNMLDMNVTDIFFAGEAGSLPILRDVVLGYVLSRPGQLIMPNIWPHEGIDDMKDWMVNGASHGAAMTAWQLLAEPPLEGPAWECAAEDRRNMNHAHGIRYFGNEEGAFVSAKLEGKPHIGVQELFGAEL